MSEERLDDETERLIDEAIYHEQTLQGTLGHNARTAQSWLAAREHARNSTIAALRSRIRTLVDMAFAKGQDSILDPDGSGRAHLNARI